MDILIAREVPEPDENVPTNGDGKEQSRPSVETTNARAWLMKWRRARNENCWKILRSKGICREKEVIECSPHNKQIMSNLWQYTAAQTCGERIVTKSSFDPSPGPNWTPKTLAATKTCRDALEQVLAGISVRFVFFFWFPRFLRPTCGA